MNYTKKQLIEAISYWSKQLKQLNENLDFSEENFNKIKAFLEKNKKTILKGLNYIEKNFYSLGFENALKKVGFKYIVVPNEKWSEGKDDPTQTSYANKNVQVKQEYLDANPDFTQFKDEYGWALHEMVHAIIASKNFPKEFMNINSPFGYPANTNEIYAFGFQVMHINDSQLEKLKKYESREINERAIYFDFLKKIVK